MSRDYKQHTLEVFFYIYMAVDVPSHSYITAPGFNAHWVMIIIVAIETASLSIKIKSLGYALFVHEGCTHICHFIFVNFKRKTIMAKPKPKINA